LEVTRIRTQKAGLEINEADQLEGCARNRDDRETQIKFAELGLRATQRIGELSRELEKAQG